MRKDWKSSYQLRQIFSTLSQLNCSNFRFKHRERSWSYQNLLKKKKISRGMGRGRSKILFPEKIIHIIFETNSNFHAK